MFLHKDRAPLLLSPGGERGLLSKTDSIYFICEKIEKLTLKKYATKIKIHIFSKYLLRATVL